MKNLVGLGLVAWLAFGGVACGTTDLLIENDAVEVDNGNGDPGLAETAVDVTPDPTVEATPDALEAGETASDATEVNEVEVEVGPKAFLSARKVAKIADLIGGDNAYGLVNRAWIIENSRVRFLVQDAGTSVHLYIYGGNLIDADVERAAGVAGNDQFREMFAIVGFRVSSSEKVEVIADGSDGKQAVLRVTGQDVNTNMIALLDNLAQPLGVTIQTDYILDPDVPYVLIRTTAINPTATGLSDVAVGDFLSFGGAQHVFTPEKGFGDSAGDVSVVATRGRGASYGYTVTHGTMNLPMVDASGTVALLGTNFAVPPNGGRASFDRYFIVGSGDIASVMEVAYGLRGDATVTLGGTVKDEKGAALAGARVTAVVPKGVGGDRHAASQAVVALDGTYSMKLPAGTYDVVATAPGRATKTASADLSTHGVTVDLAFAAAGQLGLSVTEVDAADPTTAKPVAAMPGKASLICLDDGGASDKAIEESDGSCARSTDESMDNVDRWCELGAYPMGAGKDSICTVLNSAHGIPASVAVKPGHYKVVVSRGPEFELDTVQDVEVKAGETSWVDAKLFRSVDTAGYVAADFHQHTMGSLDAGLEWHEKVIENLDEGVEFAADTEHDMMRSYKPAITDLQVEHWLQGIDADEVSVNTVGHFNVFGQTGELFADSGWAGPLYPYVGTKLFSGKTIPELDAAVRAIPGVKLFQMNHPRDGAAGYAGWVLFDPTTGVSHNPNEPMMWDFNMMEVKDSLGAPDQYLPSSDTAMAQMALSGGASIPVMRDWFAWLNAGHPIAAVHNSDTHFRNNGVGYGRNLLRVGKGTPDAFGLTAVADAVKNQQVVVSSGAFLQVFVEGAEHLGSSDVVTPDAQGKVVARLKVQAPSWIDVNQFEVYGNGRPLMLEAALGQVLQKVGPIDGKLLTVPIPVEGTTATAVVRADVDIQLYPTVDTWYVFVVRGAGNMAPVNGGGVFAYSNALYVDVDGGGFKPLWSGL